MTSVALFELVLLLLGAALVLSLVAEHLHLPPAAALVIGGMLLAVTPGVPSFDLDPDLILVLFLPPLLLSSAFMTVWRDFRADLRPILALSVGAVVFTTAIVGLVAHLLAPGLAWAACFALGAIVSPPDAVAAKAVLQRLALPRRLLTILEGESLVNDASGLVLYRFAVAAALSGGFNAPVAAATFVWLGVGGVGIGLLCGIVTNAAMRRLKDGRAVIVTSFLASWASYLIAEKLGASGVLAVVTCGIIFGVKQHETLTARVRIQAEAVWDSVVFVLEAFVFVLIGLSLRGVMHRNGGDAVALPAGLPVALAVTAAVVLSRIAWVFPAVYIPRWLSRRRRARDPAPPIAVPIVIGWAGMRGVVTLAAALALPIAFPGRDLVLLSSFVVILFTVLVQGTTLGPLIGALRLDMVPEPSKKVMDLASTRVSVYEAALMSLEAQLVSEGSTDLLHPKLTEEYRRRVRASSRFRDEAEALSPGRRDHFVAALGAVAAGRSELLHLHRERKVHESVVRMIEAELDLEELRLKSLGMIA